MPLLINTLFAKPLRVIGEEVQKNLGVQSERMTDLLAGYTVVRTFNLGDWILERFEQANGDVLKLRCAAYAPKQPWLAPMISPACLASSPLLWAPTWS